MSFLKRRGIAAGQPALSTTATVASAAGVYPITITAGTVHSANYAPSFAPGELELTLWTFAEWQNRHFTPIGASAAATADPDGDGLPNLLEYALALDPRTPDAGDLLRPALHDGHLTLDYLHRRDTADLRYLPEASSDLVSWLSEPTALNIEATTALSPWIDLVTVRDHTPLETANRRFLRLRVDLVTP